jgi:hypothetical protein
VVTTGGGSLLGQDLRAVRVLGLRNEGEQVEATVISSSSSLAPIIEQEGATYVVDVLRDWRGQRRNETAGRDGKDMRERRRARTAQIKERRAGRVISARVRWTPSDQRRPRAKELGTSYEEQSRLGNTGTRSAGTSHADARVLLRTERKVEAGRTADHGVLELRDDVEREAGAAKKELVGLPHLF